MTTTSQVYRTSNVFLARGVLVALAIVTAVIPIAVITYLATDATSSGEWICPLIVSIFIVVVLGACCASHHRIEIDDQGARLIWFPLYNKKILAADIDSVTTTRVSAWRNGLGIRLLGGATLALMNRGGEGALICTKDKRNYIIVINQPHELAETILRISRITQSSGQFPNDQVRTRQDTAE